MASEDMRGVCHDLGGLAREPEPEATAFSVITTLLATHARQCTNSAARNFMISLAYALGIGIENPRVAVRFCLWAPRCTAPSSRAR
jgi:hypothetical protein